MKASQANSPFVCSTDTFNRFGQSSELIKRRPSESIWMDARTTVIDFLGPAIDFACKGQGLKEQWKLHL